MNENKNYRFETLSLHAGQVPDPVTLSRGIAVTGQVRMYLKVRSTVQTSSLSKSWETFIPGS